MRRYATKQQAHTGTDRNTASGRFNLAPTEEQKLSVTENIQARNKINRYNRFQVPDGEENMNRLLALKRDLCCVPGCKAKFIYWTPGGKFCGKHREEAIAAMAAHKRKRYGDA